MRDVWLIVRREFVTRARSKGFLVATAIGLLAIVSLNFAPSLFDAFFSGRQVKIAVSDETAVFYRRLQANLVDQLPNGQPRYLLTPVQLSPEQAAREVETGGHDAVLLVQARPSGAGDPYSFTLISENVLGLEERTRLTAALSSVATILRLEQRGVNPGEAAALFAPVELETRVTGTGAQTEEAAAESWALTYVLVLMLYATVIIYGTYLATGVVADKSTRVVEILVSTVRPFRLMLGKVLGLGLVALLQYGVWVGTGLVLLLAGRAVGEIEVGPLALEFSKVDPGLLAAFLVFFLLGFFSYAGLFAAGGSLLSRTEDAQQVTGPLSFILVVVFLVSIYALENPDGPVSVAFSLIPLLSPIVMFVRVAVGQPPLWQLGLSLASSLVAIAALIAVAAKVFRAGVLMYGQGFSLRALRRALR